MTRLTKDGLLRAHFRDVPDCKGRLQCNFRCSYCFQRIMNVQQYPFTEKHFEQTKKIWNKLSELDDEIIVRINFQGETLIDEWAKKCSFYIDHTPNVKICEFLTNNSINPNQYLHEIDVKKTAFNCSFHPECITAEKFIKHALILKDAGCNVFANIVAFPQVIKEIPKLTETFEKNKIPLKLQGFLTPWNGISARKLLKAIPRIPSFLKENGPFSDPRRIICPENYYNGKRYPMGYTEEERRILKKYFPSKEEYEYLVELKKTKGRPCYAGVDMINIFMDGEVRRCFHGHIGTVDELVDGKVKLKENPYPCEWDNCPCTALFICLKEFKDKYKLSDKFVDNYDYGCGI